MKALGFGVKEKGNELSIDVPTWRATKDISIKADIVEEITRVYGYDNIEAKPTLQPVKLNRMGRDIVRTYDLKFALADKYHMHEIHSYIWEDAQTNNTLGIKTQSHIALVNSIQKDNDDIRSNMLPTIIRALNINKRYSSEYGLFEIGHVVTGIKDGLAVEEQVLGMGWCVDKDKLSSKLLEVKDCIHYLFDYVLKLDCKLVVSESTHNYIAPVNHYTIKCGDAVVGEIGVVHPVVQHKIDKDKYMIVAEVNTTKLNGLDSYNVKVEAVSKYPTTTLDFNFVLGCDEVYGKLEEVAHNIKTELAYKVQLVDIFNNVVDNTKSYTIRYLVTSMDHTLSSDEIEIFHKAVISTFEKNKIYLKAE